MSVDNIVIALPKDDDQASTLKAVLKALKIKFEVAESPYNPEFVAKIKKGDKEFIAGEGIKMSVDELKDLCK